MRRRTTTLLALVTGAALLAGCTGNADEPGTTAASTEATTESSTEATADEPTTSEAPTDDPTNADEPTEGLPPFPEGTDTQEQDFASGGDLVLIDVRVAEHDGFDRIVLEFTGTAVPGWRVEYVDEATRQGSGEAITLEGTALLDIWASSTTYPASEAEYYPGPQQFDPEDGGDIEEVFVDGTFEGLTHVVAGIDDGAVPFRVFTLTEPSRLVVDVVDTDD